MSIKKTTKVFPIPDDFKVTDAVRALAKQNGWPNPDTEVQAFIDHHRFAGTLGSDWERGFHTWLRKAVEFNSRRKGGPFQRSPAPATPTPKPNGHAKGAEPPISDEQRRANIGKLTAIASQLAKDKEMPVTNLNQRREELRRQAALLRARKG